MRILFGHAANATHGPLALPSRMYFVPAADIVLAFLSMFHKRIELLAENTAMGVQSRYTLTRWDQVGTKWCAFTLSSKSK